MFIHVSSCFFQSIAFVLCYTPLHVAFVGLLVCTFSKCRQIGTEFRITPVNSGYYTLRIYAKVYVNMFRVKPRATLGLIFFTVLIQNSDKQWKVLSGCLEKVALGNSLGQLFPDNHCGLSTVYTKSLGQFYQGHPGWAIPSTLLQSCWNQNKCIFVAHNFFGSKSPTNHWAPLK